MKPFNLEAALNGAKVVTRGGKPVTELMKFTTVRPYNLVAAIGGFLFEFTETGNINDNKINHVYDLFMAD